MLSVACRQVLERRAKRSGCYVALLSSRRIFRILLRVTGVILRSEAMYLWLILSIKPGYCSKNHWYRCMAVY